MHGAGNDYVFVDGFTQELPTDPARLAVQLSNRHTGVGADGLICIAPSKIADARMLMWNADGSRGEMCGNGLRCVAKLLHDHDLIHWPEGDEGPLTIETDAGLRTAWLQIADGCVERVRLNMGQPIFCSEDIPTLLPGDPPILQRVAVGDETVVVTCVSMGNPHAIVYVDDLHDDIVLRLGPLLERHPVFPSRTNVEFVQVLSREEVVVRVWERGSGETQACGSGACAVAVAGVLTGQTGRRLAVHLPGGTLDIEWTPQDDVLLSGPATEVFCGEWPLEAVPQVDSEQQPHVLRFAA